MSRSLTAQVEQIYRDNKARTYGKSKAYIEIVYQANADVMRLCMRKAPQHEIEQALDTLSALTGIRRKES